MATGIKDGIDAHKWAVQGDKVRHIDGYCLEAGDTGGDPGFIAISGRSPFPSIRGGNPVDITRPYLDLRRLEDG